MDDRRHATIPRRARVLFAALLALATASGSRLLAQACSGGTPLVPAEGSLWGELKPSAVLLDATQWSGSQLPNKRYPISTMVDVENGYVFHSFYGGISLWDARTNPAQPSQMTMIGGFEGGFPSWPGLTEFTQIVFSIDAPAGDDSIAAVGAITPVGVSVWDFSNKTQIRAVYQDKGKFVYQVHAANIGGRSYAFAGDFQNDQGLHVYDMTQARANTTACIETTPKTISCPGVYKGRIGPKEGIKYVSGVAAGGKYFVAATGGYGGATGVKIWDVTNPTVPAQVLQAYTGSFVHGVALWTDAGTDYLALRIGATAEIHDVTSCLTGGCSGLGTPLWTATLKPYPESLQWLSVNFSRSGSTPFLYFGHHDPCSSDGGLQSEYLLDVSNPASPRDVKPPQTIVDQGVNVDYWSWYYATPARGFSNVGPRYGVFNGKYFYRAGASIFDVHEWTGSSGPPVASFTWSPTTVYLGDPITFTSTSVGAPTSFQWTFPDGTPSTATTSSAQTTFGSLGNKSVKLDVSNAQGADPDGETRIVAVLDPAPAVGAITHSPSSPLVCQPVTLTANDVTGKPPLGIDWTVLNALSNPVASGSGNPFTWTTSGQSSGNYTVNVRVSKSGYPDATSSKVVSLGALPGLPAEGSFAITTDPFSAGTVTFHVQAPGATEWKWDFGDGTVWPATGFSSDPETGPNPTHPYATIGQKSVKVWVRNCVEGGEVGVGSAIKTVEILIVAPLKVDLFQAQGCQIFCDFTVNVPITFQLVVEGSPTEYQYDWNGNGFGGADDQTSPTPIDTHTYSAVGFYAPAVRLRRGTEVSAPFVHATISVQNGQPPPPPPPPPTPTTTIVGPSSGLVNQPYTFSASGSNCTPGSTWNWNPGGGTISGSSTGSSVSITWSSGGTKTVQASSGNCPLGSKGLSITDNTTGGMTAVFNYSPVNPQPNQPVHFDSAGSTGSPVVIFWEFGDGESEFGAAPTHTFKTLGNFIVKLTLQKDCVSGVCSSQASASKTVVVSGPQLTAEFQTSATCQSDLTGVSCAADVGNSVSFTYTGSGGTSQSWNFGDGETAEGAQVSHTWKNPGSFLVRLTVGNGTATASNSLPFILTGEPVPQLKQVLLPWLAQTKGALVQSSDLYIHNPGATPMEVNVEFRKKGLPDANPPRADRTIAPGATFYSADVLKELFNKENLAGFLWLTVDGKDATPVITSFNTTFQDGQEFGQTVGGQTPSAGTPVTVGTQHLVGLNDNEERLAYFGVSNPNDKAAAYHVRVFDHDGKQLGESTGDFIVSRFGQQQFQSKQIQDNFGVTDEDDYRVEIETKSGGPLVPYASNLRLFSNDPSFIDSGASRAARVFLIGALSTPGLNNTLWQTDALLANVNGEPITADMTFTGLGLTATPTSPLHLTLPPGSTQRLVNVIDSQWGIKNGVGVLTITTSSAGAFPYVQGESYENTNPTKRFGQSMMAVAESDAADAGEAHYLAGLRQDAKSRTTFWAFNPGTTTAEYDVIYRGLDGAVLGTMAGVRLGAGKIRQFPPGQHPLPAAGVTNGFTVEVKVKTGKVLTAAQVVNNATNDPAYIRGEVR